MEAVKAQQRATSTGGFLVPIPMKIMLNLGETYAAVFYPSMLPVCGALGPKQNALVELFSSHMDLGLLGSLE